MSIPTATNSSSRITPTINITRARLSWPSFGIQIPIKETNIQNSEFRGSDRVGCFGVGLELTGSTGSDYNKLGSNCSMRRGRNVLLLSARSVHGLQIQISSWATSWAARLDAKTASLFERKIAVPSHTSQDSSWRSGSPLTLLRIPEPLER